MTPNSVSMTIDPPLHGPSLGGGPAPGHNERPFPARHITVRAARAIGDTPRRSGRARPWAPRRVGAVKLARRGGPVNEVDRGITRCISALPPSPLDTVMKGLSTAANHSVLWFAVAACWPPPRARPARPRRAGCWPSPGPARPRTPCCKPLLPRRRPAASELPAYQTLHRPRPRRRRSRRGTPPRPRRSPPRWAWRAPGWGWRSPRSRRRWPTRGCTWACTGPPTSSPAPRWAAGWPC